MERTMKTFIGLILGAGILCGQGNSPSALVRAMNNRILQHHSAIQGAEGSAAAAIRAQAGPDIRQRRAALAGLIESDPQEALKLAFSTDLLDELRGEFPDSAPQFETHGKWRGVVEYLIGDDFKQKSSKSVRRLKTGTQTLTLHFGGPEPKLISGMTVTVAGLLAGDNVAAEGEVAYDSTGGPLGMACGDTGAQNIVTILANLPDYKLPSGVTSDLMNGILYGNSYTSLQNSPNWSVDDFWQQNSDGQTWASYSGGRIVGPFSLKSNFNTDSSGAAYCDYQGLLQGAINAADGAVNFQNFNRVIVVFPYNGSCSWAGLSSLGCWSNSSPISGAFTASASWLRADQLTGRTTGVQLAAHELGHGLGLHHASSRDFSTPWPRVPAGTPGTQGTWDEYGDVFSAMGYWSLGLYPASQAEGILGWLGAGNYQTVTSSGQYSVQAYETRNTPGAVKALKILRDPASNSWLWLEFRTNAGNYDSQLNSQAWSGALIRYEDSFTNTHSNLLDFTPATSVFSDPALAVGQTWIDTYTNLSITVNNIAGNTLNVTVNYGPPPCVHANPSVALSPANPSVNGGYSTAYTVAVTNNDTPPCASSTFNLTAAQPSGFTGTLAQNSLTLAPGAQATTTLTEKASSTVGTYPVSVAVTSSSNPSYSATGNANLTVTSACMPANPTVTLSPDSAYVVPGGSVAFSVTVKNNNSPACSSVKFGITAPAVAGVTAKLSSTALSLSSGASSKITLTETAGTTAATVAVRVVATNLTTTSYVGSATAGLTIEPCVPANPSVTFTPGNLSANFSTAAKFTVTVKNNNSRSCPSATFSLAAASISGLSASLSTSSLTIATGSSAAATLTETTAKVAGVFSPSVKATNKSYTTYFASGSASLTVVPTTVAIATDASGYTPLSPVTITASVAGATPIANVYVTFSLKKPSGTSTTYKVLTNSAGVATWKYTLASTDPVGTYTVGGTATVSNVAYAGVAKQFSVAR